MTTTVIACLTILVLAFAQNIAFSIVSRSRNRDNIKYHIYAASASNLVWFLTFKKLILEDMSYTVLPFYVIGTVIGSVYGVKISMRIEKWLGATSDGHLKEETKNITKSEISNLCSGCEKSMLCESRRDGIRFCTGFRIDEDLL